MKYIGLCIWMHRNGGYSLNTFEQIYLDELENHGLWIIIMQWMIECFIYYIYHPVFRWCRTCCWRKEAWSKWKVSTSWWPLIRSFSHRALTSWILPTQKQCKNYHIYSNLCDKIVYIWMVSCGSSLQTRERLEKLCLFDNRRRYRHQLQWKGKTLFTEVLKVLFCLTKLWVSFRYTSYESWRQSQIKQSPSLNVTWT